MGESDGTVQGLQYFSCPDMYGTFLRPKDVQEGDYPPEEEDFDMENDMI